MESLDLVNPYLFRHKRRNFLTGGNMLPSDIDALLDFEIRPTDIFIITYPKSGRLLVLARVPFIEERAKDDPCRERPDPRFFGTHLPPDMLPLGVREKQVKIVYVWRNPKDVLVSLYHFAQSWVFLETPRSFEDFFQQFLDGDVYMGSWFDHLREYISARDQLNIHFVNYESMLKVVNHLFLKICAFLGRDLTDEAIDHIVEKSTFTNMKRNPKQAHLSVCFVCAGTAGEWKNFFTVAQNEQFDRLFQEKMTGFPLTCVWEIQP
uniref:Sulfotransferase n=1 Tax=Salarias fasciatus TaxID=181472 RepID=A0A672JJB5_SALFA